MVIIERRWVVLDGKDFRMIKRRSIISLLIYSVLLAIFVINGKASHTRKVSYDVLVPARDCGVYHRLSWCSWWFLCHYHWVTECYTVYHHETRYYTECLDGWTGKYCDIRYKCVAPETCKCLTTGGSCTSVPCSPQQSCFPGTCVGGKCQCPQTHGGEDCQQIQIMPTIEVCEVTIQDEKTILSQATCAYQDQELPNVRVNSKNWKQISLNIEAKAKDFNFPTSRGLDHISFPLKFGVASGGFNLYKNDRKLNMKTCEITAEVAKVYYKCHVSENANALELNHGDIITIEAFSSLGGTKEGTKIPGIDNSFFRKVIFTGVKAMRNISFQVDVEPPTHCYKKGCNYTPIQLDKDITSDPAIQPKFYGWDDEDSGIKYYHVQVFLMHLSYENVFVNLGEPFLDRQLKPKDPDFDNFVVNCKKPGVHSIELTVYDGSNNTEKARNIFIYTGPTKPKINLDNPIMISDAKQNNKTGEYWITDELFHKKNRILKISWDGHFMSEAKFTDEWAHPVDPWRGKGYEDLPEPDLFIGIRTINRLDELKYGIMTYSIAHYIDQVEGGIAYNYTNVKLLNSTTLEEEIDARTSRLGATIGIKLSAYDVAGEKKEKEIKIRIDTTAPELKNWTLIQNDPDIYTSKVLLVIKDKESGLDKINFKLLQVLDGSNKFPIISGEAEIITKYPPKILPYRKKRKSLKGSCQISDEDCYCTPYRSCFTNNQFITIDHCWIDRQVKAKNTIEIQFEVFNQAGISSGVRIMELTDLDDLHCRPEFKLTGGQLFAVVFCTLIGFVLISAVLALLVRIYIFKKPPPSTMLHAYSNFRDRFRGQRNHPMETSNELYVSAEDDFKVRKRPSTNYKNDKVKLVDDSNSIKFISEDDVQINDEINRGSAMIISKGFFNDGRTKLLVAIKSLKNGASQKAVSAMNSKAEGLASLSLHENIIKVFGLIRSSNGHMIAMEYCNVTLKSWLCKMSDLTPDALDDVLSFAINISKGVQHLHKHYIIHKRLGMRNVLLSKQFNQYVAKLIGFEVTKNNDEDKISVPIKWLAPETLSTISKKCPNYSKMSDAWSYGITLWEMFTLGKHQPYPDLGSNDAKIKIISGRIMGCPKECPPDIFDKVMLPCWSTNPKERPSFSEILKLLENFKKGGDGVQVGYYSSEDPLKVDRPQDHYTDGS